jgi:hypothetical protein
MIMIDLGCRIRTSKVPSLPAHLPRINSSRFDVCASFQTTFTAPPDSSTKSDMVLRHAMTCRSIDCPIRVSWMSRIQELPKAVHLHLHPAMYVVNMLERGVAYVINGQGSLLSFHTDPVQNLVICLRREGQI